MASEKKYWKNIAQLDMENASLQALEQREFAEKLPVNESPSELEDATATSRRDFLKLAGFSTAAATLAACEGPVIKSVPYVVQPEQIRPGVANYYATAIADGFDFASILIKTREGRPIKVESNKDAAVFGGANARVHASVLSMYDTQRLQGPKANGADISWEDFNTQLKAQLEALAASNKRVVLLTQTMPSPTTANIIQQFQAKYSNVEHLVYDAVPASAALEAFENIYGQRALADYDLSTAKAIVALGADFLGDWQGGGYEAGYAKSRIPVQENGKAQMSWHMQVESNMSLSGANADRRVPSTPAEQRNFLAALYNTLTGSAAQVELREELQSAVAAAAKQLKAHAKHAVVLCGLEDVAAQEVALAINAYLESSLIDVNAPRYIRQAKSSEINSFLADLKAGKIAGVITAGINPLYTLADATAVADAFAKAELSVAFSSKMDETATQARYVAATPHYLEAWGDYEFKAGHYALAQPTIQPLFDTRQFQDVLLDLIGAETNYYDAIQNYWESSILNGGSWNQALHDGFYTVTAADETQQLQAPDVTAQLASLSSQSSAMSLVLYTKTGMGDGQQGNNPWLQEFPDPITRVSWDNYLTVSQADANRLGLMNENTSNGALNGSYATVQVGDAKLTAPVIVQPGQAVGTVGLALGYGERLGLKPEMQVGVNAYTLFKDFNPVQSVEVAVAEGTHEFACVQLHNTLMGRGDIVKETTLEIFNTKDKAHWNTIPVVSKNHMEMEVTSPEVDMWQEFDRSIGHHFNLSIDLNACTGCGACVIACHAENNVPVVGKREIRKSRDMHWLRIDRYYSSEATFEADNQTKDDIAGLGDSLTTFGQMELASANPQVAFQPVMCQHCNHAPCETVCPVAASSHGRQGQNHMAYNRCVGTRYCANNCPYKVRRFNWFLYNKNDEFDFHMNNDLGRMVLNPDVVVRSRGVMEKCSMCIQMTQKTILDAKLEGRQIKDGEFQTACSNACDAGAMVFGDINDKESSVAALKADDRMYHLLEHIGTKPNVMYQVKVRNTEA
ncbi:MAG: TAT-variant-translocated molybdopterin oxidoreductase [Flavobacteriaceae bacterium]